MNGETLKRIRAELGMSQEELAAKLKKDRRTVIRWEQGEWPVPLTIGAFVTMMREEAQQQTKGKRR